MINFETILAPIKVQGLVDYNDRKVFSIPCTKWSQHVVQKFNVFELPNSGRDMIRYKPVFLTFRQGEEGEMSNLFKVDKLIILDFKHDLDMFMKDKRFDFNYRKRVKDYSDYMQTMGVWEQLPEGDKLVFFLSDTHIELKNRPRPIINNLSSKYYELSRLLNNSVV